MTGECTREQTTTSYDSCDVECTRGTFVGGRHDARRSRCPSSSSIAQFVARDEWCANPFSASTFTRHRSFVPSIASFVVDALGVRRPHYPKRRWTEKTTARVERDGDDARTTRATADEITRRFHRQATTTLHPSMRVQQHRACTCFGRAKNGYCCMHEYAVYDATERDSALRHRLRMDDCVECAAQPCFSARTLINSVNSVRVALPPASEVTIDQTRRLPGPDQSATERTHVRQRWRISSLGPGGPRLITSRRRRH